mmetsp:Transcript_53227/g.116202  ORF Transcript_53227/g.116202 Transcript_53227/m.116202 type:complete len:83 (+) Transcript_53227:487-735(+)
MDDIIITAGHNLSSVEIELCAQKFEPIVEAATVGIPDEVKGLAVCVFVVVHNDVKLSKQEIAKGVNDYIRKHIGVIATPKEV